VLIRDQGSSCGFELGISGLEYRGAKSARRVL
jgi:hypothetical protein